jgi:cysteine desulfurase
VRATGIIFTGGGTEANNLAIRGSVEALLKRGNSHSNIEIITTRLEHPSVQKTIEHLGERGLVVKYVTVNEEGLIDMREFETLLSPKTKLVSIAYVNSETGVLQDIKKISRIVKKWNQSHDGHVLMHTDACQAPLWLSCALDALGVDMLTLDAGKCYGPKGVGVLARRQGVLLEPIVYGGGQEKGQRAGTENTALIVGCALAIEEAQERFEERSAHVCALRDFGLSLITRELPEAVINGSMEHRVANNINVSLPGFDTEFAVIVLDKHGIAASTRSACGSLEQAGSHVVREMTKDDTRAFSTLRFTLGEESEKKDLIAACSVLRMHYTRMSHVHKTSSI